MKSRFINKRYFSLDFKQKNFEIPFLNNRKLILKERNKHQNDNNIIFNSLTHTYYFNDNNNNNNNNNNNKLVTKSVTQLIEKYFDKFDPDVAITNMENGPNWPRPEYTWKDVPLTREQIKKKWDDIGTYARNRGTWLHYNIESHLNGDEVEGFKDAVLLEEMKQFHSFEKNVLIPNEITPYRTEWVIGSKELDIAGTVDFVGKLPNGTFVLMDWKRSLKLPKNLVNTWKNAKSPISHLQDCEGVKYSLQLNLYKYILRNVYGLDVQQMILTSFHNKLPEYFSTDVKDLQNEAELLLNSKF